MRSGDRMAMALLGVKAGLLPSRAKVEVPTPLMHGRPKHKTCPQAVLQCGSMPH